MRSFLSGTSLRTTNSFISGLAPSIQMLNLHVEEIAREIPVLVMGESGTGKEVCARVIHWLSKLGNMPLKKVSCRAAELLTLKSDLRRCADNSAGDLGLFFSIALTSWIQRAKRLCFRSCRTGRQRKTALFVCALSPLPLETWRKKSNREIPEGIVFSDQRGLSAPSTAQRQKRGDSAVYESFSCDTRSRIRA